MPKVRYILSIFHQNETAQVKRSNLALTLFVVLTDTPWISALTGLIHVCVLVPFLVGPALVLSALYPHLVWLQVQVTRGGMQNICHTYDCEFWNPSISPPSLY